MMPAVTVVIPCYNHAHYLAQAVQSVLAQKFTNWEAIIVDDGSTDDTADVAARFQDPRVCYIRQDNQGLSAARNTGIHAAHGKYLAFVDADDEWEPQFLQQCTRVLEADDTLAGVFTRNYFIDGHGAILPQIGGQAVPRAHFRRRNLEGGFFSTGAVLVRATAVREAGLFDTQLTSEEDWDLWIRISLHSEMQGIPDILAHYRVYPGSMSTNAARMHANRIVILTKYFGSPQGNPATWPEEKRRTFGFAYRTTCITYMQQGQPDEGWHFLAQAAAIWPDLLGRLDTFYELACGDRPWGYRGQASRLDIASNGAEMLRRLDDVFAQAGPTLEPMHGKAYGNAYTALGILYDQAGHWAAARRCLSQAIKSNPRLLVAYPVVRRLVKLCSGQRLVRLGRALRRAR